METITHHQEPSGDSFSCLMLEAARSELGQDLSLTEIEMKYLLTKLL